MKSIQNEHEQTDVTIHPHRNFGGWRGWFPFLFQKSMQPWLWLQTLAGVIFLWGMAAVGHAESWRTAYFQQPQTTLAITNIPWSEYTHVIQCAAVPTFVNGIPGINTTSYWISANAALFTGTAHNHGCKALYSVMVGADAATAMQTNTSPALIDRFVTSLTNFAITNNYDGIDLDWEGGVIQSQYTNLVVKLRTALPTKILTAATGVEWRNLVKLVQDRLDQMNVMVYESDLGYFSGHAATNVWYNTAVRKGAFTYDAITNNPTQEETMWYFSVSGLNMQKVGLGIPFYGRVKTGPRMGYANAGVTAVNQIYATNSAGALPNTRNPITYPALLKSIYWTNGVKVWDDSHKAPSISYSVGSTNGDAFVTYTDPQQIQESVRLARELGLGGMMAFELSWEYDSNATNDGRYPLSMALADAMLSPVGWWNLDDAAGSTTAADDSGNGQTGTLYGAPLPAWVSGKMGGALQFNGTNYMQVTNSPALQALGVSNTDFSVAFWMRLDQGFTGNWRSVMHKGNVGLTDRTLALWMTPTDNRLLYNGVAYTYSTTALTVGQWTHVAYVKSGNNISLYLNGILDASATLSAATVGDNGPLYLGKDPWNDGTKEALDDVQIYNWALNATDLRVLFAPVGMISAGNNHSLALKANGAVWAWGANGNGQLGDGSTMDRSNAVQTVGVTRAIGIAGGGGQSLAVWRDGTIRAWGLNSYGQLGDGTAGTNRTTSVSTLNLSHTIVVSAGGNAYNYHSLALMGDGTVWGCGYNASGELGDGTTTFRRLTPVQAIVISNVTMLAAGGFHSAALKRDGTVWTWGYDVSGQLGDGTNVTRSIPAPVLSNMLAVAASTYNTLALKNDGTVWGCGYNGNGQLGATGYGSNLSTPIQIAGMSNVTAIAMGGSHALALKNDGTVWAWGNNGSGQLGDGTISSKLTPVRVAGLSNVVAIAAGNSHSLALRNDGTIWAWGCNANGQLGDGTLLNRSNAVQVSGLNITN